MGICCKVCGKENEDGNVVCEFCGNMLIDIFPTPDLNQTIPSQSHQKSEVSVASVQGDNAESQNIETVELNQLIQQSDISTGGLGEYFFKIGSLTNIDEFVKMAKSSRKDTGLGDNDKKEVLDKLKKRARDVFGEEINYYEDNGTFLSNLGNAGICFILRLILGAIFAPLGILCYIGVIYFVCKAIGRLVTFPKSNRAARIVKKLEECGLYQRP